MSLRLSPNRAGQFVADILTDLSSYSLSGVGNIWKYLIGTGSVVGDRAASIRTAGLKLWSILLAWVIETNFGEIQSWMFVGTPLKW